MSCPAPHEPLSCLLVSTLYGYGHCCFARHRHKCNLDPRFVYLCQLFFMVIALLKDISVAFKQTIFAYQKLSDQWLSQPAV